MVQTEEKREATEPLRRPSHIDDPRIPPDSVESIIWANKFAEAYHQALFERYLKFKPIAEAVSSMSKDPSTKVGAIALDENMNIISTGYNGFPRGVKDLPERYDDRAVKYKLVSHAEQNLVAQAAYGGRSLRGATVLLTSLFPCSSCAKSLIQAGVIRVVSPSPNTDPRWEEEAHFASLMFAEAGVEVLYYPAEVTLNKE